MPPRSETVEKPASRDDDVASAAMERYAGGDEAAFGELYDLLAPRLYDYLMGQVRNRALAEDLVQQTFLQLHRARGSFLAGADVRPWAFAIARRLFIDRVRHERRLAVSGERLQTDEPVCFETAEHTARAYEIAQRLSERLARLPETQRAAFELLRMDGLSHCEAAATLGISVNAVKLRAHRADVALHAAIAAILPDASEE